MNFRLAFKQMTQLEKDTFGENSYFVQRDSGRLQHDMMVDQDMVDNGNLSDLADSPFRISVDRRRPFWFLE